MHNTKLMSRASKTVREVLKHGQSGQLIGEEKYNFIRGNPGQNPQFADVSALQERIEVLEYELSKLEDKQRSTQNNYDAVSRMLHEERLKVNEKEKKVLQRNIELEHQLRVESSRIKVKTGHQDLLDRIAKLEREKQQLEDNLTMKQKESGLEV